ncbi:MAG: T9SS type A sorting domain-containing protein [Bacteroidetes bacterium]|nr:T9SS type A sorting domain-containing protein [Bacteroidota bacterium]HET6243821.1 T9SS type A sorting domain-containing protein [Bacteroidia bacterium]
MRKLILFSMVVVLQGLVQAQESWQPTNGPYGATINCLAASDTRIFAGTDRGLYFSDDGSKTWNFNNYEFTRAIFHYRGKLFIYTGKYYVSLDNGDSWQEMIQNDNFYFHSSSWDGVPRFAAIDDTVFFCHQGGILKCGFNDNTWKLVIGGNFVSFAAGNNTLIASTKRQNEGKTCISYNNGLSWKTIDSPRSSNALEFKGDSIFLGYHISPNLGQTWLEQTISIPAYLRTFFMDTDTLYAGTINGVYYSVDNGLTWNYLGTGLERKNVTSFVKFKGHLFAGTDNFNGIYKFNNGTWEEASIFLNGAPVYSLSNTDAGLLASINQKLYKLDEKKQKWEKISPDLSTQFAFSDSGKPTPYFSPGYITQAQTYKGDIYIIDDKLQLSILKQGGNEWEVIFPDSTNDISAKSFLKHKGKLLLSTTHGLYELEGKSYKYLGGENYSLLDSDNDFIYGFTRQELFRSDDGGITFKKIAILSWLGIWEIYSAKVKGDIICIGTFNQGLYISRDGGATWNKAWEDNSNMRFKNLVSNIVIEDSLIAITVNYNGNLLFTKDFGKTWEPMNEGIDFDLENDLAGNKIWRLVVRDGKLYASLNRGGVYIHSMELSSNVSIESEAINRINFLLHPNPTSSHFTLSFEAEKADVTITDFSGRIMLQRQVKSNENISTSGFSKGIYFVQVKVGEDLVRRKLVIN